MDEHCPTSNRDIAPVPVLWAGSCEEPGGSAVGGDRSARVLKAEEYVFDVRRMTANRPHIVVWFWSRRYRRQHFRR